MLVRAKCAVKYSFLKWANPGLFFVHFRPFLITISIIQIDKSMYGVLGIRIRGLRMVGTDETTELWRPVKYSLGLVRIKPFAPKQPFSTCMLMSGVST